MSTPFLRIYDSSIFNYLKYEIIPLQFTERVTNETLSFDTVSNSYITSPTIDPSPISYGRGWVIFDEATVNNRTVVDTSSEQVSQVVVTGASTYDIDYINGRIINPDTTPTSVSYSWYYVSVIQGWPGISPPPLPVVAIDLDRTFKSGYQLGGGTKDTIEGSVYVFATSEGEKRDLTDVIYQSLYNRSIPIRNWHEGNYLDYDGTFTDFNPTTVSGVTSGYFTEVSVNLSGPRMDWSELNRYRSRINFVFEVFKDD